MNQKKTLQFNTLADLVQFQKAIHMPSYRINATAITLTGQLSDKEILLAIDSYRGKILQSEPTLQEQEY
ncbi:MAG TPA: hypothetical protein VD794_13490 [Flavisolibacter sp.]|nr:hypothetical protein [Flavisolibacter sp.]